MSGFSAIPITYSNEDQHRRLIAQKVNGLNQGKFNCYIDFTLSANAATTTLQDARIGAFSTLGFMPTTATAAAELSTLFVTDLTSGQATINHSNAVTTDRTFRVSILG